MRFPSIRDVAAELEGIKLDLPPVTDEQRSNGPCDDDGTSIDVRLQVEDSGVWQVHSGDASYDTDHSGYWGASSVDADTVCRELARDLLDQARDHYAQCH